MEMLTKARLIKLIAAIMMAAGLGTYYLADSLEKDLMQLDKSFLDQAVLR